MPLHTCAALLTRRLLCFNYRRRSSGGAGAAMSHPKHPGEVSPCAPTVSSRAMHALWTALSPAVCSVCFCVGTSGHLPRLWAHFQQGSRRSQQMQQMSNA